MFGGKAIALTFIALMMAGVALAQDDENPTTPGAIPNPGTYQGSSELQRQSDQQDQQYRQSQQPPPYQQPGPSGYSQTYGATPGDGEAGGTSGSWEIFMNCGRGGAVGEPNAVFYHGRYARRFAGGATSLSMTVLSHNRIHVRGVITFDNGMVDPVDAIASGNGTLFTGSGLFGKKTGCPFTAIRH
jgi:hypothetical protein